MPEIKLSLLIDDNMLSSVSHVVENCKKAGLNVDSVLGEIGVITGTIDQDKVSILKGVSGVADVEEQATYQLAPPESDIQ